MHLVIYAAGVRKLRRVWWFLNTRGPRFHRAFAVGVGVLALIAVIQRDWLFALLGSLVFALCLSYVRLGPYPGTKVSAGAYDEMERFIDTHAGSVLVDDEYVYLVFSWRRAPWGADRSILRAKSVDEIPGVAERFLLDTGRVTRNWHPVPPAGAPESSPVPPRRRSLRELRRETDWLAPTAAELDALFEGVRAARYLRVVDDDQ